MVKKIHKPPQKAFDTYGEFIDEQDDIEVLEFDDEEEQEQIEDIKAPVVQKTILKSSVKNLVKNASGNINNARKLMRLFRSACHTNDENAVDFESPETFNLIITASLKTFPKLFRVTFKDKNLKPSLKTSFKNLLRSFFSNTLFLLKQVRDCALLVAIFRGLTKVSKFLTFFNEYTKNFVKAAAKIWGETQKSGKLICYNFIRKMMERNAYDKVDVLRLLYISYAKNSKFMSWVSYIGVDIMRNCFVELLGLDLSASYQIVFTSMRQLSVYLSQIVKNPSADRIKSIYNWQYLNSLILLGRCVSSYSDLFDLASPLIQIISGVLSLTNIPKYFPLKLHLARILISLQSHCKMYIPSITPNLIEIVTSPSLSRGTSSKKLKEFSFVVAIKGSKDQLASELYREQLIDESCECLIECFGSISNIVAFPEVFLPVAITLKKYCKNLRNSVFREKVLHCLRLGKANSDWVEKARKSVKSVKDLCYLAGLAPISKKCERILHRRQEIVNSKVII